MIQRRLEAGRPPIDGSRRLGKALGLLGPELDIVCSKLGGVTRTATDGCEIFRQGMPLEHVVFLLDGWACTTRSLSDGRRQSQAILLPGDLHATCLPKIGLADHSLTALTAVTYLEMRRERVRHVMEEHHAIGRAIWSYGSRIGALQREWIVTLGCRSGIERIAHLFCELILRLQSIGLAHGHSCYVPMTQDEIADSTGMTAVHVNRTLQQLRTSGLIAFSRHELVIHNWDALQSIASFSPEYLTYDTEPLTPKQHRVTGGHTRESRSSATFVRDDSVCAQ